MSEILQLLNDFQGIIGTILGSVTTLIVTDILKKRGQLKNYLVSYEAKFQTFRDVGCSMGGKRDEDFYGYSIKMQKNNIPLSLIMKKPEDILLISHILMRWKLPILLQKKYRY